MTLHRRSGSGFSDYPGMVDRGGHPHPLAIDLSAHWNGILEKYRIRDTYVEFMDFHGCACTAPIAGA
ncbi:hypothetical protein ASZ90_010523 [hydrocarbon metagenome]|uniref:Uncharacterized protein n=1 Tax=hydrocarbon metagenome TaxID=938273 RepID=A0A0W8FFV2_9ZZZZ